MITVGIKELKNSLSFYLRKVRSGHAVVVTDRGRSVAQIIPTASPEKLRRLMAEGRVSWSGANFIAPKKRIKPKPGRPLSDFIAEERL